MTFYFAAPDPMEMWLPMRLVATANKREHKFRTSARARKQKEQTAWNLMSRREDLAPFQERYAAGCRIRVTVRRHGPGVMDLHDGLPNACKHVVDEVARVFLPPGQEHAKAPDNDPRFVWKYEQVTQREHVVLIRLEALDDDRPAADDQRPRIEDRGPIRQPETRLAQPGNHDAGLDERSRTRDGDPRIPVPERDGQDAGRRPVPAGTAAVLAAMRAAVPRWPTDPRSARNAGAESGAEVSDAAPGSGETPERPHRYRECLTAAQAHLIDGTTDGDQDGWNAHRPCPYVGCKYHLALDVQDGRLIVRWRGEIEDMPVTCALDVANALVGTETLQAIGQSLDVTRERIRQICDTAMAKLRLRPPAALRKALTVIR